MANFVSYKNLCRVNPTLYERSTASVKLDVPLRAPTQDLVEQFDARPAEIKALFSNQLDPTRTAELRDWMLRAGLPVDASSVAANMVRAPLIAVPCH